MGTVSVHLRTGQDRPALVDSSGNFLVSVSQYSCSSDPTVFENLYSLGCSHRSGFLTCPPDTLRLSPPESLVEKTSLPEGRWGGPVGSHGNQG